MTVRTRFAPSPSGYLHLGGARAALFNWVYARQHHGTFLLRIEDTDQERSSAQSVQAILDGLNWLGLQWDEGPFYQTLRLARYHEVCQQLVQAGVAYPCYATAEELEVMRETQRAAGLKPRYDGRWRPEPGKNLPTPPPHVKPVYRFKTPLSGEVGWHDAIKGPISFANEELDDLVLLRQDGFPTYNFGVVIDDVDMAITDVIRGDDHVNNTPRQIHLFNALGAALPRFAHMPMILGDDGARLSKRHGAVNLLHYRDEGYLPQAMVNYLARLGWSHGDDETFSREQLVEWFTLAQVTRAPAHFDPVKLSWLNQHYLKSSADLAKLLAPHLGKSVASALHGDAAIALYRERCSTVTDLARQINALASHQPQPAVDGKDALALLRQKLAECPWNKDELARAIKEVLQATGLKMPQLAQPLRLLLTGTTQTPSIDLLLAAFQRQTVLARLDKAIGRTEQGV